MPEIRFKKLNPEAVIPKYQTTGAAGFDFHLLEDVSFLPQQILAIGTGLSAAIPAGFMLMLLPRSSAGVKFQLRLANTAGVIDSDYRGEIICVLHNNSANHFRFAKGDRLVQGILVPVPQHTILEVDDLGSTERGAGGFGSTDKKPQIPETELFTCLSGFRWAEPTLKNADLCAESAKGLIDVLYLEESWNGISAEQKIKESVLAAGLGFAYEATKRLHYVRNGREWMRVVGIRPASVPF